MSDETEKTPLKVILVYPLVPSLEWATPILFQQSEDFTITMVQGGQFAFSAFDPDAPSLFIFSVLDATTRTLVKSWLERKPPLPPGHRILVISEDKKGVAVGGWKSLGVNEYILGPVVAQTIVQKLQRHKNKMEAEMGEAGIKRPPKKVRAPTDRVLLPGSSDPLAKEFAVHGVVLGPNTFLFPHEPVEEKEDRQVVVQTEIKGIDPTRGQWQPSPKPAAPGAEGEQSWDWVQTVGAPDQGSDDGGFRFVGLKPTFDAATGQWRFSGKAPMMFHNKPGQPAEAAGAETMFGYHTNCGVVMYKASQGQSQNARVWFVRQDDFRGTVLEHFQKKPKVTEASGTDSELLKVLNNALKTSQIHGKKNK